jgi:predicted nucleic acid-binding protein
MIVVDTNMIAYLLIEGRRSEQAREVHRRDRDWMSPPLWRDEFLNVLCTHHRAGNLSQSAVSETWLAALDLMEGFEVPTDDLQTLLTALDHGLTSYDARFVVAARTLGTQLVTGDRRVAKACPDLAVHLDDFL